MEDKETNKVTVRWFDGYLEDFEATEVRFGCDLLWMRLDNGNNRHIPLRQVRWFGMSKESHQEIKVNEVPAASALESVIERLEKLKTYELDMADTKSELMQRGKLGTYVCLEDVLEILKYAAK